MVSTYILWAELTVTYNIVYFKFTCVIMILLIKTK